MVACSQSPEDKANKLIKAELRKTLYKPESYKPIDTNIDSAFAPLNDPAFFELLNEVAIIGKEVEDLNRTMKDAKSTIAIYSGPYQSAYDKNRITEAKEEYDLAEKKYDKLLDKGKKVYLEIVQELAKEPKFIGYIATHNYRADNNAGNTLIGNGVFIIDPDFKKVLFKCEMEDYNEIQDNINTLVEQIKETE